MPTVFARCSMMERSSAFNRTPMTVVVRGNLRRQLVQDVAVYLLDADGHDYPISM